MAAVLLQNAMKKEEERKNAEAELKAAKAEVIKHLENFSTVSKAGNSLTIQSKETNYVTKMFGRNEANDEQLKALKAIGEKARVLATEVHHAAAYFSQWDKKSLDVFGKFKAASESYNTKCSEFEVLEKELKNLGHIPTSTEAEKKFVLEYVLKDKAVFPNNYYLW